MITQELLDYELHLDGKHVADFDDLETARHFGGTRVTSDLAKECVVINKWTGEIMYHAFEKMVRRVVEE